MEVFRAGLFEGKRALVTGGGTGIGYAIAKDLASLGANVLIASRKLEQCQKAADRLNAELKMRGERVGEVSAARCNIRSMDDIENLVTTALERLGKIDFLVNNAGGQFLSPAEDLTPNGWASVVQVNLNGTFLLCRQVFQEWMADNGGSIVNITVGNGNGYPGMCHSGAARAGVENMTKTLSIEWIGSQVRLNCVAPGVIFTPSGATNYGPAVDDLLPKIMGTIPARRCGTAEEVSGCVCFLLSPAASYVTGTTVKVDGGGGMTFLPLASVPEHSNLPIFGDLDPRAKL